MTKDVIELAREASCASWSSFAKAWVVSPELERFAALVAARERERCAKVCDEQHDKARSSPGAARAMFCADRIRALNTEGEGNDPITG